VVPRPGLEAVTNRKIPSFRRELNPHREDNKKTDLRGIGCEDGRWV
jgi:hypothetical protein